MARYFPCDVKLRLLAHSRSFLANQKARNAIVGAENLLIIDSLFQSLGGLGMSEIKRVSERKNEEGLRRGDIERVMTCREENLSLELGNKLGD